MFVSDIGQSFDLYLFATIIISEKIQAIKFSSFKVLNKGMYLQVLYFINNN